MKDLTETRVSSLTKLLTFEISYNLLNPDFRKKHRVRENTKTLVVLFFNRTYTRIDSQVREGTRAHRIGKIDWIPRLGLTDSAKILFTVLITKNIKIIHRSKYLFK